MRRKSVLAAALSLSAALTAVIAPTAAALPSLSGKKVEYNVLAADGVSVDAIEEWRPVSLFLTHFGPVTPARAHLARVHERLDAARAAIEASLKDGRTDEERVHAFVTRLRQEARRTLPEHEAAAAELAAPFDQLWQGLARYAKKKREAR